jgi:cytochrome c
MRRMIATVLRLGCSVWDGTAGECDSLKKRGRSLSKEMCAGCHAIGISGQSPHIGAPAFRDLDRRIDFDRFEERLPGGLMSGHPDMPTFRFTRSDARAFIAYLRFIQAHAK